MPKNSGQKGKESSDLRIMTVRIPRKVMDQRRTAGTTPEDYKQFAMQYVKRRVVYILEKMEKIEPGTSVMGIAWIGARQNKERDDDYDYGLVELSNNNMIGYILNNKKDIPTERGEEKLNLGYPNRVDLGYFRQRKIDGKSDIYLPFKGAQWRTDAQPVTGKKRGTGTNRPGMPVPVKRKSSGSDTTVTKKKRTD